VKSNQSQIYLLICTEDRLNWTAKLIKVLGCGYLALKWTSRFIEKCYRSVRKLIFAEMGSF